MASTRRSHRARARQVHGGFLYYEVVEILQGLAKQGDIVGVDLVEVAPDYDHSGTTAFLAARVLLDILGYVFHERSQRTRTP